LVPHAPQLFVSVCRFRHELPQSVSPVAQLQLFPPALQHEPFEQLPQGPLPQAPQLFVSVQRFLQPVPEQYVLPAVAHEQVPLEHTASDEAHALPQPPQLFLSEVSSTHAPEQQLWPAAHLAPQAPQLFTSLDVFMHAVPQTVAVAPEHMIPHDPPEQLAAPVPAVGPEHLCPHAPQLFASVPSFTHEPLHVV
jgi:hypothetical protein